MSRKLRLQPSWIIIGLFGALLLLLGTVGVIDALSEAIQWPVSNSDTPVRVGPAFSPPPGIYASGGLGNSIWVEMRGSDPDGQIIFTTDGTSPGPRLGTLYERPLRLDTRYGRVVVIRAVEVVNGEPGPVSEATYVVGIPGTLPVLSLVAEPADLWGEEQGVFTHLWERGNAWERPVHITLLNTTDSNGILNQMRNTHQDVEFSVPAGLRIHGTEPTESPKQSLRLYFRNAYGMSRMSSSALTSPLFPGSVLPVDQSYKRLLLQAGDCEGRWTLFRDQLVTEVATELGLHAAQGRFVRLFINGETWGIYRLSERIDRFFLQDRADERVGGGENIDLVQDGRPREGDDEAWDALMDWVQDHNLVDSTQYAYLESRLDLDNFTDFAVLQLYFGFSGADLFAARSRGGRWFFLYEGGTTFAQLPDDVIPALQPGAELDDFSFLLRALLDNPAYRVQFAERTADLLNTVLAEERMAERVIYWQGVLADDITYESERWPASLDWEDNVKALLRFVEERPDQVRGQLVERLGAGNPVVWQFETVPADSGWIFVNGEPLVTDVDVRKADEGTYARVYFAGTSLQVTAVPKPGYTFVEWRRAGTDSETEVEWDVLPEVNQTVTIPVDAGTHSVPHLFRAHFASHAAADVTLRPDDVLINEMWINDNGTRYVTVGQRPIEGDWIELWIRRVPDAASGPDVASGMDLRGWRLTDNDKKTGTDEGSIIFPSIDVLASIPEDTIILILATETESNAVYFPEDDLDARDGQMLFYVGNGLLDVTTDPGFGLGTGNDNLVLLTSDDVGIDFVAEGVTVTPYSFGVLADGVTFTSPFQHLGGDDGALFVHRGGNDDISDWIVDPTACQSGDAVCLDSVDIVTPGALNNGQHGWDVWGILK